MCFLFTFILISYLQYFHYIFILSSMQCEVYICWTYYLFIFEFWLLNDFLNLLDCSCPCSCSNSWRASCCCHHVSFLYWQFFSIKIISLNDLDNLDTNTLIGLTYVSCRIFLLWFLSGDCFVLVNCIVHLAKNIDKKMWVSVDSIPI